MLERRESVVFWRERSDCRAPVESRMNMRRLPEISTRSSFLERKWRSEFRPLMWASQVKEAASGESLAMKESGWGGAGFLGAGALGSMGSSVVTRVDLRTEAKAAESRMRPVSHAPAARHVARPPSAVRTSVTTAPSRRRATAYEALPNA